MNSRERFLAIMHGEPGSRALRWEFGYWAGAVRRWYAEGLPRKVSLPDDLGDGETAYGGGGAWVPGKVLGADVHACLGLDEGIRRIPVENLMCPAFSREVLEDHGDWLLVRDENGVVRRERRDQGTVPHYVRGPVAGRADWEQLREERLRPTLEGRLLMDWDKWLAEARERTYPLSLGAGGIGFFSPLRTLFGVEGALLTFHDDPQLIKDIVNYLADFWIALYDPILDQIGVDMALIWEDMCYKAGPLISPAMFREFLLPAYKKLTGFYRNHGIDIILVDTDGDCRPLIPLFIEGGVTGLYPFEVTAGQDIVEVRKAFPELHILGGLDKKQIAAGREAIDRELEAKVPFMLERGRYIPYVDHMVPPEVSWEDFQYYRQRLGEMIEMYTVK